MLQPSDGVVGEESLDSSSAKWEYEFARIKRFDATLETCGSEARSQVEPSSSTDERDARDEEAGDGGKMRSLI